MIGRLLLLVLLLAGCSAPAAPPATSSTSPNALWSQRQIHFLGLGDSVTRGFGASTGRGYFDQLSRRLQSTFPRLTAHNISVSSTTSGHHLNVQLPRVATASPDVYGWVVITSGGNDLIHNYGRTPPEEEAMYGATLEQAKPWIANFRKRTEELLDGIKTRYPGGVRVFLATIYDPTDGVGDIENGNLPLPPWKHGLPILQAYNEILRDAAARRPEVYLVDMHKAFMGHGIHHGNRPYFYFANLEDPNDAGYDRLTEEFFAAMAGSVSDSPVP